MTVEEFYDSKFADRDSLEFQELAAKIASGVDEIFRSKRAAYTSSVISIQ